MAEHNYVLLDTDVYSYLTKTGDTRGAVYRPHVEGKTICVSFITVGEILYGAKKKKWSETKIEDAKQKLKSVVIVPYDYELCVRYGELKAALESGGITVALHDLWIAACALRHSIPLMSNNRRHFENIPGLELISEAPVVAQIDSQAKLFPPGEATTSASANEPAPPSSQSSSES